MIVVRRPAPLLTIQDAGRFGYRADGVTTSGPLDPLAHAVANGLVNNAIDAAALEGCLGGAAFTFERATMFALTGAHLGATLDGAPIPCYERVDARAGSELVIGNLTRGAVWYLAVGGGIDVPPVLGSRSTLVSGGLGGLDGGPVRAGVTLARGKRVRSNVVARPTVPDALGTNVDDGARIPITPATRSDALTEDDWRALLESNFVVSRAISRVGYRLEGPALPARLAADLASEPACAGAVQLPPEGQPIVLMADHPTIGGYPMIGVVPAHALGQMAQRGPGAAVRFQRETAKDARARFEAQRATLTRWLGET